MGHMSLLDQIAKRYCEPALITRNYMRDEDGETESTLDASDGEKYRGLAVPFNSVTRISDWFDGDFDEQFLPGAFTETLANRRVTLLFEHGYNRMIDRMPIGSFDSIEETERGLEFVATPFENWLTEPVRNAVSAGALQKMSIGFRAQDFDIFEQEDEEDGVPLVSHSRVELPEMSIVLWPAYEDTELSLDFSQPQLSNAPGGSAANPTRGRNQSKEHRPKYALAKARLTLEELT